VRIEQATSNADRHLTGSFFSAELTGKTLCFAK